MKRRTRHQTRLHGPAPFGNSSLTHVCHCGSCPEVMLVVKTTAEGLLRTPPHLRRSTTRPRHSVCRCRKLLRLCNPTLLSRICRTFTVSVINLQHSPELVDDILNGAYTDRRQLLLVTAEDQPLDLRQSVPETPWPTSARRSSKVVDDDGGRAIDDWPAIASQGNVPGSTTCCVRGSCGS